MVVAQAFTLMEFHLTRLYLQKHFRFQCSRRGKQYIAFCILKLPPGSDTRHFSCISLCKVKSCSPAQIPALCPEGVSEYFEIVLLLLYHIIEIPIHWDQIEFRKNREIGNHLFILDFTTSSELIIFQRLLPLLSVVGQIIAFIFIIFYNFAVYMKLYFPKLFSFQFRQKSYYLLWFVIQVKGQKIK